MNTYGNILYLIIVFCVIITIIQHKEHKNIILTLCKLYFPVLNDNDTVNMSYLVIFL